LLIDSKLVKILFRLGKIINIFVFLFKLFSILKLKENKVIYLNFIFFLKECIKYILDIHFLYKIYYYHLILIKSKSPPKKKINNLINIR
jgi:hypothetical protein